MIAAPTVLLTGATGYVGGRLLPMLQERGHRVRCLARKPEYLTPRVAPETEVVAGDVMDRSTLDAAMKGVETAYYLVHSMGSSGRFEELDRGAAENFSTAAREAGVAHIIYLGGLGESGSDLSSHLQSRQEVGEILRQHAGTTRVTEFRASIVIGSGSVSFEMIRALVERLPIMVMPRWVSVLAQPIAIDDLLRYLVAGLEATDTGHRIYEIGGRDVMSYHDIMREYARQRGLRRMLIPVPVLTPRLSSLWLGLVTPVYARVGRKLIDSLRHPTVVLDATAESTFNVQPRGVTDAIADALRAETPEGFTTSWTSAISAGGTATQWGGVRFGNRLVDSRSVRVTVPPEAAFRPIRRIGGQNGWYYGDWLWRLRGWLDLLVGGVGMRRGRRDPDRLVPGDALDWWRVVACEPASRLLLSAEMKLPGRAWLEFSVVPDGTGSIIRQTAVFDPVGVPGLAYWYSTYILHQLVFAGMLAGIARAAGGAIAANASSLAAPLPHDGRLPIGKQAVPSIPVR